MARGRGRRGRPPTPGSPDAARALGALDATVLRQATVLAYNHAFLLVALSFALAIPLAWFLRGNSGSAPTEAVAVEV